MYERYAADGPIPPDPAAPSTTPGPSRTRLRPTTKCLVVRDGRACCIRFAETRDPEGNPQGDGTAGTASEAGGAAGSANEDEPAGAGRWSLPGGGVEPDESVYAAAEREVREEVGLDVRAVTVLDAYSYYLEAEGGVERNLALVVQCEERERRAVDTDANPAAVEEIAAHEWVPLAGVGDRVIGAALGEILDRRVLGTDD